MTDAVAAASVILLRDGPGGLEVLMLRRSAKVSFAAGAWVFPGGRVDAEDGRPGDEGEIPPARRAAAREVREETGLVISADSLVVRSRWLPPAASPKRFSTWFFVGTGSDAVVTVDGGEILEHLWALPAEVIQRHRQGDIELYPPTWVTLWQLMDYPDAATARRAAAQAEPEMFETQFVPVEGAAVALWQGDAAYDNHDLTRPGRRRRLWMRPGNWHFEQA
jgi:8-oxo-dGTP pyrophosphatase MutT (NUDIX family)